jgi:hypothetical protein
MGLPTLGTSVGIRHEELVKEEVELQGLTVLNIL